MTRLKSALFLAIAGSLAMACGGGGHDVDPRVIPGGGVGDPDIDGEVNVFVIDDGTDDPIAGADVYVGDTLMGTTDSDGLFVASGDLSGPQDITAVASDYASSTFFGANGANVTIPLSLSHPDTPVPETANLSGTISGWDSMQPPSGEALIAIVTYSVSADDNDPANNIDQGNPAGNVCLKTQLDPTAPCDWSLITRTGSQTVFALIGHGTIGQSGGTLTMTDFAYASGITVQNGVDQSGITLDVASHNDIETADVSLPSAPSGTDTVAALARINIGDDGRIQIPLTDISGPNFTLMFDQVIAPKASLFDGSTADVLGIASDSAGSGAQSVRWDHDVGSLAGASLGTFLTLPQNITTDGTDFSFDAVDGASVHIVNVVDSTGAGAWGGISLDGRTDLTLPAMVELPQGSLTFTAQALELPDFDPQDFEIDSLQDTITRVSADNVDFTN
jgi:hypothetical protein